MPSFPSVIDLTTFVADGYGFVIVGDAAYDRAGHCVSSAGDVNGDGVDDLIVGAPGGDDGGSDAGEAYVIFGKAGAARANVDLSALAATDGFVIIGDAASDVLGRSVSSAGDINGDGVDDLIVGARSGDLGGNSAGQAYIIFGKAGATRANIDLGALDQSDGFIIIGDAAGDLLGESISSAGDVNGDGIDDVIVGALQGGDGGSNAGEAYVIFGKAGATRSSIDLGMLAATDGFVIQGDVAGDNAGRSVSSAGDVNGDGIDDLIVGAVYGDDGGDRAGEAYVIFGKAGSTRANIDLSSLAATEGFIIQGNDDFDRAGNSVSSAGDVNGDGIDDLIVGAYTADDGGVSVGKAYVIFGKSGASRANIDLSALAATDGFVIIGDTNFGAAGFSVSDAGDVDGDGIDDLIVGAPRGDDGGLNAGEAYVIFGKTGATRANIDLGSLTASEGFEIIGDAAGDQTGYSVSSAGDVNGDGVDDILVGAFFGDDGGTNAGEAYVIFGRAPATGGSDILAGLNGDDVVDLLDGDDTYSGLAGNDTITGGDGADSMAGDGGDDVFIVSSGEADTGEVIDGGADNDTIRITGGGVVSLKGVTVTGVEAIVFTSLESTTLQLDDETLALLVTSAPGALDRVEIGAWTGGDYDLGVLFSLLDAGVEQIGFAGYRGNDVEVTRDTNGTPDDLKDDRVQLVFTDAPGGDAKPYVTQTKTFERDGDIRSNATLFDLGHSSLTLFDADGLMTSNTITDSPGNVLNYQGFNATYTAGVIDRSTLADDFGNTTVTDYIGGVKSQVVRTDGAEGTAADRAIWTTETTDFNLANGTVAQRTIVYDAGEALKLQIATYDGSGVQTELFRRFANNDERTDAFASGALAVTTLLSAATGSRTVTGQGQANTITGGTGNDLLRGGGGDDLFLFSGTFGNDRIADFDANPGDRLDLTAYNIDALADIAGNGFTASQVGRNTVIDLGANGTITLANFQIANLDDGDFVT